MYTQFFQLKQAPFSIAPDPRYLFMSERHREALAHLLYGLGCGGGFVLLTGEIGAGKTTVCRCLLEQIPEHCTAAYVFNPKQTVEELLQSICEEFRIDLRDIAAGASAKQYVDRLNAYLLHSHAAGRNNVLIIDEAQNLTPEVLEQLRLLTNLETTERKLLQIILIGQPELRDMLARPELEQLAQRVVARYHLGALSLVETAHYIQHRLNSAGLTQASPFPGAIMPLIHRITRGVPRRINLLCDRVLLGAYAANRHTITRAMLKHAAAEVFGANRSTWSIKFPHWHSRPSIKTAGTAFTALAVLVLAVFGVLWSMHKVSNQEQAVASSTAMKLSRSLSPSTLVDTGNPQRTSSASPTAENAALTTTKHVDDLNSIFNPAMREESFAYRQLGQLWGLTLADTATCEQAPAQDLQCYRGSGGLDALRRLNRPAVLTLRAPHKTRAYALLTALTPDTATLQVAGSQQRIAIDPTLLARYVRSEFITLWRTPPGYTGKIRPGARGTDVDWLTAQLGRLTGVANNVAGQPYDAAMVRRLRDFQLAQGLSDDGVAGPQTLMLPNNAVALDEPHLQMQPTIHVAAGK
ncbi:MAG: AAA family ATPase [Proteobacteria bacterium]|nr:AAA family ATPase [Pseudomonadota bacterium]